MLTRCLQALCLSLVVVALLAPAIQANPEYLGSAKVALHLQPYVAKSTCLPASQGGQAPDLTPCVQFETAGLVETGYNAYLVVSAPDGLSDGVAGLSCGIEYDPDPQSGVDVFSWLTCSDLEFPNAGAYGDWPASGGGNRMTFDSQLNCQRATVPGYESEGVQAVFGAFYVYAYDTDYFSVTPNLNLMSGPELVVGNCSGAETDLNPNVGGALAFSDDGSISGCNPCLQPCDETLNCAVPTALDFGTVALGDTRDLSFTITNTGIADMDGNVASSCGNFVVISGAGSYTLTPGASRTVTVRYEATIAGFQYCNLFVGGLCPTVYLSAFTPPPCAVSPSSLHLGTVAQGDTATGQIFFFNNKIDDLTFSLNYTCPEFTVLEGNGPFVVAPGQSMSLTLEFVPTAAQVYNCFIQTGTECGTVLVTGIGVVDAPVCDIFPTSLDFGSVFVGDFTYRTFSITNDGGQPLTGSVSENCSNFYIVSGEGPFSLDLNETHHVMVSFAPISEGQKNCVINVTGGCGDVSVTGYGSYTPPHGQDHAVIALHASAHAAKSSCEDAPSIPCTDYTVNWPVQQASDLWLVVARGGEPGIGGLSCGILYEDGQVGGLTLNNGVGVDVYSWIFCASGLQFPNSPTGLIADEWPASGGGNRMTWDISTDCQTTAIGMDGIHAVAGSFYVYAYSVDQFQVTPNNNVSTAPELQVADCAYATFNLNYPQDAAVCGFGGTWGFNPCSAAVPVRLLSFTALRSDAGAEIRWVVAGADEDHAGFDVYRGVTDGDRVRVSDELLFGRERYLFVDDSSPSVAVRYWLAERSRAGDVTWHGPVELEAASVAAPGFALHRASPNPFLSTTNIAFRTGDDGPVTVRVFDTAGREVARPFAGALPAGEQEIAWDGRSAGGARLPAGIYFYRVETVQGGAAGKVVLIR